jgi:hypothetical protein
LGRTADAPDSKRPNFSKRDDKDLCIPASVLVVLMPVDVVLFVFVGNKAQIVDGLSVVQCRELLSQLHYLRRRIVQRLRFGFTTPSFSPRLFGEILNERKPMILFLPVTFPAHTESSRLRGPRCGQLKQRIRFFSRQEIFNVLVLFAHDFSSPSTRQ